MTYRSDQVVRFNEFEDLMILLVATLGDGGNHGCEGDFGKAICGAIERR